MSNTTTTTVSTRHGRPGAMTRFGEAAAVAALGVGMIAGTAQVDHSQGWPWWAIVFILIGARIILFAVSNIAFGYVHGPVTAIWRYARRIRVTFAPGEASSPSPRVVDRVPEAATFSNAPAQRRFSEWFVPPFEFKPSKRVQTANGAESVLTVVQVINRRSKPDPVTNCTARLVRVLHRVMGLDDEGEVEWKEREIEVAPVYLKWADQDGGGRTCTFVNDACFELAEIDTPSASFIQIRTHEMGLRGQYRYAIEQEDLTFIVEIADDTGRRAEHGFLIGRNPLGQLGRFMPREEPLRSTQLVKFKISDIWLARAMHRVAELDQSGPDILRLLRGGAGEG